MKDENEAVLALRKLNQMCGGSLLQQLEEEEDRDEMSCPARYTLLVALGLALAGDLETECRCRGMTLPRGIEGFLLPACNNLAYIYRVLLAHGYFNGLVVLRPDEWPYPFTAIGMLAVQPEVCLPDRWSTHWHEVENLVTVVHMHKAYQEQVRAFLNWFHSDEVEVLMNILH